MNTELAKQLLISTMGWDVDTAATELPKLVALARYKYDAYSNFEPGMRFLESLAIWLEQFDQEERPAALEFVKERLIFISSDEMIHLVSLAYPDCIHPVLCAQAAKKLKVPVYKTGSIHMANCLKELRRQSLFLGLSDGAKMDHFRRLNPALTNDQVYVSYDISENRMKEMVAALRKDMGVSNDSPESKFRNIFLLDDFSGSGTSLLRYDEENRETPFDGKLEKTIDRLVEPRYYHLDKNQLEIHVVLYLATEQALRHLQGHTAKLERHHGNTFRIVVHAVHVLPDSVRVTEERDPEFDRILAKHYDPDLSDRHTRKGRTQDIIHGFAGCALPLVLWHNTPNNSVYLLWAEGGTRPLFRRITRHRVE